ncbi:uncharacterized protein BO88DRAFT_51801 [Aspergillus vadensis CBS 113365]|uniref:Uncharacterized protein n=1 Tax=Aspergillus vadensis (strain CBS 113365 / IMI 142717 / IBT 24658) TaxID=1448311 RepID=A0A319B7W2_ASPVC|nr:hypothetical protein BO88DRAFT_51801 [Aspergillus vadensis CBS 113365]PYH68807.1 hypothetical protein BO88DRAFT_51801 [Aspergillus vadensis CBS 113365]
MVWYRTLQRAGPSGLQPGLTQQSHCRGRPDCLHGRGQLGTCWGQCFPLWLHGSPH